MTIENKYLTLSVLLICICMVIILLSCSYDGAIPSSKSWKIIERGSIVEVAYGSETDFPQYVALHLESGYFRLNYGPGSGWVTPSNDPNDDNVGFWAASNQIIRSWQYTVIAKP